MSQLQFIQRPNPVTGQSEWATLPQDYDFQQEIACSAYGDMLHDTDRNRGYYAGLQAAMAQLRQRGWPVRVLDIGTGSGLLSMMAVQLGADHVTACEAFTPVAECAAKVLAANGVAERVQLVAKRSTELAVGVDLQQRATLVVGELFDTELIGEGALQSFSHAAQHLMVPGGLLVPPAATVHCQLFSSDWLAAHQSLLPCSELAAKVPSVVGHCCGVPAPLELQASELREGTDFQLLSQPMQIAEFDFAKCSTSSSCRSVQPVQWLACFDDCQREDGDDDTVLVAGCFFWWRLRMTPIDAEEMITISTAPKWHNAREYQWREHWMQAVFYFASAHQLPAKGSSSSSSSSWQLHYWHDGYSNYFDLTNDSDLLKSPSSAAAAAAVPPDQRNCSCGLHLAASRQRLAELQQAQTREAAADWLRQLLQLLQPSCVACIGDTSLLLPSLCRQLAPESCDVISVELQSRAAEIAADVGAEDGFCVVQCLEEAGRKGDSNHRNLLLAEPYFGSSSLPWEDLRFWYLAMNSSTEWDIYPNVCSIWAVPMQFEHLHKLRAPVGSDCSGFDLTEFDKLASSGAANAWPQLESQQLWEYPGQLLADPQMLIRLPLAEFSPTSREPITASCTFHLSIPGVCNGVALWCQWYAAVQGKEFLVQTGRCQSTGEWNRLRRQAVLLHDCKGGADVQLTAQFEVETARLRLSVEC